MSKKQKASKVGNREWLIENPLMTTIKYSRYKFIAKMISSNDVVLDLGCGTGISSLFYSNYCKKVYGYDLLSEFVEVKKKNNIKFIRGDALKLNVNDFVKKRVDMISCVDFIEHFSEKDGTKIIEKCSKILHQNGNTLIIGTPSVHSKKFRSKTSKIQHLHEYDPLELKRKCLKYFSRVFLFSMNDEVVNTGFHKLSWFTFVICVK